MATLQAPRSTVKLNDSKLKVIPLAAGVLVLQGSLVATKDGLALPAAADATQVVHGRANYGADNRVGAAGAVTVEVERGIFAWDNDAAAPVTQAHLGKPAYAVDDHTVSSSNASNSRPQAGVVYQIDDAGVWIETK